MAKKEIIHMPPVVAFTGEMTAVLRGNNRGESQKLAESIGFGSSGSQNRLSMGTHRRKPTMLGSRGGYST